MRNPVFSLFWKEVKKNLKYTLDSKKELEPSVYSLEFILCYFVCMVEILAVKSTTLIFDVKA